VETAVTRPKALTKRARDKVISQGTKSYLFGCHQFLLHPLFVAVAWKKYHGKMPRWKELICILIHDIGVIGRQYLEPGKKDGHWYRGARLAVILFSTTEYQLCAGHTGEGMAGYGQEKYGSRISTG